MNKARKYLLIEFILLWLGIGLSLDYSDEWRAVNCHYEALPTDLNSISYLGTIDNPQDEIHFHNDFFANFSLINHFIDFNLRVESVFRVVVAPHEVDVDLYLLNSQSETIAHSSLGISTEEVIFKILSPGAYRLKLRYFGFWIDQYKVTECDILTLELAIAPKTTLQQNIQSFSCPDQNVLPSIDFSSLASGNPVHYTSPNTFSITTPSSQNIYDVNWLTSYNFTLPNTNPYWKIENTIRYDFLTGASLGIMLEGQRTEGEPSLNCFIDSNCTLGTNARYNELMFRTLLPAGNYTLWIYEHPGEKNNSLIACTPFTFELDIDTELLQADYMNCPAVEIPDVLIPNFDEPPGFLYYHESPLVDLNAGFNGKPIFFHLKEDSFFKATVPFSPENRIDVDLKLVDNRTGNVIDYQLESGGEEVLASFLGEGDYLLYVIFFGSYSYKFCETFDLEIAIAPKSLYPDDNGACNTKNPDFSDLKSSLSETKSFSLKPDGFFTVALNPNLEKKQIFSVNFTIEENSVIEVELGDNFLLGDLQVILHSYTPVVTHTYGNRIRNGDSLRTLLTPGDYNLELSTGTIRGLPSSLNHWPKCAHYSLNVDIRPLYASGSCWKHRHIPSTLNTPQYLDPTGIVHFADEFLIPYTPGQLFNTEFITFQVTKSSIFRVWSEPHDVDIDFSLLENGLPVASTIKPENNEEEIIYNVKPGKNYKLNVNYYFTRSSDPHFVFPTCNLFKFELAINPNYDGVHCYDKLPFTNLIPNPSKEEHESFFFSSDFHFQQTEHWMHFDLPFSIKQDFYMFRSTIFYDFVWSDVSIRLLSDNETLIHAENYFGRKEIGPILLAPGDYILHIYEPAMMSLAQYRRCVHFTLTIGYELLDKKSSNVGGCQSDFVPPSLNSLPYLSVFSGKKVDLQQNFLVNIKQKLDTIDFTLDSPSLLGVFIPSHPGLKIDLFLLKKNPSSEITERIGRGRKALMLILDAGSYVLRFSYSSTLTQDFPKDWECVYFPAQISIAPLSYILSQQKTSVCSDPAIPTSLVLNQDYDQTFTRSLSNQTSTHTLTFTLTDPAVIDFDLRYRFLPGGLALKLDGTVDDGVNTGIQRSFEGQFGYNHAFFHRVLQKGQYVLTIEDPFLSLQDNRVSKNLNCDLFQISYLINTTDVPFNPCDEAESLPTDLWSLNGGSFSYGGPQDPVDGHVQIYGDDFLLSDEDGKDNFILFNITVPSFVRAFASAPEGNDIDFYLYQDSTMTNLLYSSIGVGFIESRIRKLEPQDKSYLLNVFFFRIELTETCPTFTFGLAIKPVSAVQQELICPTPLPSPLVPDPVIRVNNVIWVYNENFYFTKQMIEQNTVSNRFIYRITLYISSNTTVYCSIGFDFLANDFRLILLNEQTNVIVEQGKPSGDETHQSYLNFYNSFMTQIEQPGTYHLDIIEDLSNKDFGFTQYCHRFGFFFAAFPEIIEETPEIELVLPPGGEDIDPTHNLVIVIRFSAPVQIPQGYSLSSLPQWIHNERILHIYATNTHPPVAIYPILATFDESKTQLEVSFSSQDLHIATDYILILEPENIHSESGKSFILSDDLAGKTFKYSMKGCNCNNHGTCDQNTGICQCEAAYAGDHCNICANGYHAAGPICIPNVYCTPGFCSGHGDCDDTQGYPFCKCKPGYATVGDQYCSVCATGYEGYPNCTHKNQIEPSRCKAPIIPSSLDSIDFLGFNGQVHLQDDYYIDLDNYIHETKFSLKEDSVIRIYAEPHWVDIDLWLYDENNNVIDFGYSIGDEEILYHILKGDKANPKQYSIKFRYYVWNKDHVVDCETFNLELEIKPVQAVLSETSKYKCPPQNKFPTPTNSQPNNFLFIGAPYNYSPNTSFYVKARTNASSEPNFFYGFDFEIKAPKNQIALLQAEIGYRFLVGDLGLWLEAGSDRSFCNGTNKYLCFNGYNLYDRNIMNRYLRDGKYTLWIYEPEPQKTQLSQCSPFDFKFDVKFEPVRESRFFCEGSLFPNSLNDPGYIDPVTGYVHVQEEFLLIEDVKVNFTISQKSAIRIAGEAEFPVLFRISDAVTGTAVVLSPEFAFDPALFSQLNPGKYVLEVVAFFFSEDPCPYLNIELTIQKTNREYKSNCPSSEQLPQLPTITLPFKFPNDQSDPKPPQQFYSFRNNEVIQTYPFYLSEPAFFEASVSSDFLTGGLKLSLEWNEQGHTRKIFGSHRYNQNFINKVLDPGNYQLKLVSPRTPLPPIAFPSCDEFNFEMMLLPLDTPHLKCLQEGQDIPQFLNSIRFLGLDGEFDFQYDYFRVPSFTGFATQYIQLQVEEESLIRVYTEPHIVDIDLALYKEGQNLPVVDGGYGKNNEESIVYKLEANVPYHLTLFYYKWQDIPTECPTFNMEIAIAPFRTVSQQQCPSGGSHWPPSPPSTLNLPAQSYEYIQGQEKLYFQQKFNETASNTQHPITFKLTQEYSNFYARLTYFFLTSDIVMKLHEKNTHAVYYGANTLNGNVLRLNELPPGSYELLIYEVVKSVTQGCSYFSFEMLIEKDQKIVDDEFVEQYPALPTSLDRIPFLSFTNSTHLQHYYTMFARDSKETIHFTIKEQSLLRIATTHKIRTLEDVQIIVHQRGTPYASTMESFVHILPPDSYSIELNLPLGASVGPLIVDLELAISPISSLNNDLKPFLDPCTDSSPPVIKTNPKGAFSLTDKYSVSQSTMQTKKTIQTVDFTLDRMSEIFFEIGHQFILGDFELEISGSADVSDDKYDVFGENGRNLNTLNDVLPAGTYTLTISQPGQKFGEWMNTSLIPSHCTFFVLRFVILDADSDHTYTPCAHNDVLPWNLSSKDGGSSKFGGPIDNSGSLHLWGESFNIPDIKNQVDQMTMNLKVKSLMSITTKQNFFGDIFYTVSKGTTSKLLISPTASVYDFTQRGEIFILDATSSSQFNLGLHYSSNRVSCPAFSLQIVIQPAEKIGRDLLCPKTFTKTYPSKNITPNLQGIYTEYTESYFPSNDVALWNGNAFSYEMDLTLTKPSSRLIASLGFNSLVNMFNLQLVDSHGLESGSGEWQMQKIQTGDIHLNSGISTVLAAGTYKLRITQFAFEEPFIMSHDSPHCYPFVWDLQIYPDTMTSQILSSIEPSGASYLDPTKAIVLQVTFNTPIYNNQNKISNNNGQILKNNLYLQSQSDSAKIFPTQVFNLYNDSIHWRITFSPTFKPKVTYTLNLGNDIHDENGKVITLISHNRYTMIDDKCNNQGVFDSGYCFCNAGYAGLECETCDINFEGSKDNQGKLVCKKKGCPIDYCSCDPRKQYCSPLGTCVEVNNQPTCKCFTGYGGANCSVCADGFGPEWPVCEARKPTTTPPIPSKTSEKHSAGAKITGIILSILALLGTIVFLLIKKFKRTNHSVWSKVDDVDMPDLNEDI